MPTEEIPFHMVLENLPAEALHAQINAMRSRLGHLSKDAPERAPAIELIIKLEEERGRRHREGLRRALLGSTFRTPTPKADFPRERSFRGRPDPMWWDPAHGRDGMAMIVYSNLSHDVRGRVRDLRETAPHPSQVNFPKVLYEAGTKAIYLQTSKRVPVKQMSADDRLAEALRRAGERLPGDLRRALDGLLSPESIAIFVGILLVWALSHLTPWGYVADAALMIWGWANIGWDFGAALAHFISFVAKALTASTEEDLDDAAKEFSDFVLKVGAAAAQLILMRVLGGPLKEQLKRPVTWPQPPKPRVPGVSGVPEAPRPRPIEPVEPPEPPLRRAPLGQEPLFEPGPPVAPDPPGPTQPRLPLEPEPPLQRAPLGQEPLGEPAVPGGADPPVSQPPRTPLEPVAPEPTAPRGSAAPETPTRPVGEPAGNEPPIPRAADPPEPTAPRGGPQQESPGPRGQTAEPGARPPEQPPRGRPPVEEPPTRPRSRRPRRRRPPRPRGRGEPGRSWNPFRRFIREASRASDEASEAGGWGPGQEGPDVLDPGQFRGPGPMRDPAEFGPRARELHREHIRSRATGGEIVGRGPAQGNLRKGGLLGGVIEQAIARARDWFKHIRENPNITDKRAARREALDWLWRDIVEADEGLHSGGGDYPVDPRRLDRWGNPRTTEGTPGEWTDPYDPYGEGYPDPEGDYDLFWDD